VNFANKIGRDEIQFIVTAIDIYAFVVKSRAHGSVKNVDAIIVEYLSKVLHNMFVVRGSLFVDR
jgi:hypothetical protein